jgi:hypothetical protein
VTISISVAAHVAFLISMMFVSPAQAQTDGTKDFIARPKIGAAHLTLPSHLSWQASPDADGTYRVSLSLIVDVGSVLKNIRALSASALNKAKPCGDLLRVSDAAARLTGGGHKAFLRYERGEAAPLPAVVNLFRLLDKHPELLKDLD